MLKAQDIVSLNVKSKSRNRYGPIFMGDQLNQIFVKELLRFVFLAAIVAGVLYFLYPSVRYEYINRGETNSVLKIDKITGDVWRLDSSDGWKPINE